ncbi:MAG: VWA domain-containing protein [Cyanobacteria bacterium REEB67]|nr:VWA domain-containing protein [Cyanobacteria bacterium REEB67]
MSHLFGLFHQILFQHPQYIWYAVPGMVLVVLFWLASWRWRLRAFRQYGDERLVSRFSTAPSLLKEWLIVAAFSLAVVLCAAAATMPYLPTRPVAVPSGSLRVAAAFDSSISMDSEDNRQNDQAFGGADCSTVHGPCGSRMSIARLILRKQIMPAITGNQLGLVVYSGDGTVKSYLNDDFAPLVTLLTAWRWVDVGSAPGTGSYVETGLASALAVLDHDQNDAGKAAPGKVIILFTDGGHDGTPADLAKVVAQIRKQAVKLVIVGIGSPEPSALPLYDDQGNLTGYFPGQGQPALTSYRDDAFLQSLADSAGGVYIKASAGEPLSINWPSVLAGSKVEIQQLQLYQYPLGAAMFFLAIVFLRALPARFLSFKGRPWRRSSPSQTR